MKQQKIIINSFFQQIFRNCKAHKLYLLNLLYVFASKKEPDNKAHKMNLCFLAQTQRNSTELQEQFPKKKRKIPTRLEKTN